MGIGNLRGVMWAGVTDGRIATDTGQSADPYTPLSIALFPTKAAAREHYERVIKIDVDKMLAVASKPAGK